MSPLYHTLNIINTQHTIFTSPLKLKGSKQTPQIILHKWSNPISQLYGCTNLQTIQDSCGTARMYVWHTNPINTILLFLPNSFIKCNSHPITGYENLQNEYRYSPTHSSTLTLEGVGGQHHAPATLLPGKRPSTHCTGGWVGPRANLDGCRKLHPHWDSIPRPCSP